ncbi:MAG: rhodanese-like domain-containing protein [Clostridia bacterium]|nr:rhodanese-like domain-containing protein [Clostridia bacterium]
MKKLSGFVLILLISLFLFVLTACQDDDGNTLTYEQITVKQAKEIMDTETDYIIIDARTEEEFAEGHIENAILIPEYDIAKRAEKELPDKDALILVYCRSGRRSKIASEELVNLGYTNVKEFGGIIDWPYEIVK